MVDYRRFLKTEVVVAPWWGGDTLVLPDRRLRLATRPPAHGWFEFELKGRLAHVRGPSEALELTGCPRVRGHLVGLRLVIDGNTVRRVELRPDEEPALFAPVSARVWAGEVWLFEQVDFEHETEGLAREALAKGLGVGAIKGMSATLRAAFGYACVERAARERGVSVSPAELRPHLLHLAAHGGPAAGALLDALVEARARSEREQRAQQAHRAALALAAEVAQARAARAHTPEALDERVWAALEKAGARLESLRRLGAREAEVVFGYAGERFISVVDAQTLQVIDSGICLGHPPRDDLVTLESLPGVIQEAIDTDALVILRAP